MGQWKIRYGLMENWLALGLRFERIDKCIGGKLDIKDGIIGTVKIMDLR